MTRKIYICGDSFSCTDARYPGFHWSEKLQILLGEGYETTSLGIAGGSNFLIYLQVIKAIQDKADFCIINAAPSGRFEIQNTDLKVELTSKHSYFSKIHSFFATQNQHTGSYVNSILHRIKIKEIKLSSLFLMMNDLKFKEFGLYCNYECDMIRNHVFIESALFALQRANIPFVFHEGGFLLSRNGGDTHITKFDYFFKNELFSENRSNVNLWDHDRFKMSDNQFDPTFHIKDENNHLMIAEEYYAFIMHKMTPYDNV
jgi:hypothetical protein